MPSSLRTSLQLTEMQGTEEPVDRSDQPNPECGELRLEAPRGLQYIKGAGVVRLKGQVRQTDAADTLCLPLLSP